MLLAVALAQAASACGDDDAGETADRRSAQVEEAAREAGLPDRVAELLGDAAGVIGETFTVTYDLGGEGGGTAVLAQDPPRRRADIDTRVDGAEVRRSMFADGDAATQCERANGRWRCRDDPSSTDTPGAFGAEQIEQVVETLTSSRDAYDFRVVERRLVGADARCLVTELKPGREPTPELGAKGTLCVSDEGVPLLVETPVASLRALRYSTSVDDDVFDLPAEVSSS